MGRRETKQTLLRSLWRRKYSSWVLYLRSVQSKQVQEGPYSSKPCLIVLKPVPSSLSLRIGPGLSQWQTNQPRECTLPQWATDQGKNIRRRGTDTETCGYSWATVLGAREQAAQLSNQRKKSPAVSLVLLCVEFASFFCFCFTVVFF